MRARSGMRSGAAEPRSSSLGSGEEPAEVVRSLSASAHLPGAGGRGGARCKLSENRESCFARFAARWSLRASS
eukprot:6027574-Heterocapsa_arctica.AAC.1